MPWKNGHWKINQWEPWESGNPNGRPRKGISLIKKQLKDLWYTVPRKEDVYETLSQMQQLTEDELITLSNDKKQPMAVRIAANWYLDADEGQNYLEIIHNRVFGKPMQETKNINIEKVIDPVENSENLDDLLGKLKWDGWDTKKSTPK